MFTTHLSTELARVSTEEAHVHVIGQSVIVSRYVCSAAEALKDAARRQARVFPCENHKAAQELAAVLQ